MMHRNSKRGFTLIEIIIAMFLFALVVATVAGFMVYYFKNYAFSFEENQSIGLAQNAFTTMVREIREARSAEDGGWALAQTDDNTFTFYSDITNDGRTDRVRYFLDGNKLKKGVIEPTQDPIAYPLANEKIKIIADFVENSGTPLVRYYNGDWPGDVVNNPLVSSARLLNTRYVSLYLRININTNTGAQPFELKSGVQIRGLKSNL